jgi:hypothetical protein
MQVCWPAVAGMLGKVVPALDKGATEVSAASVASIRWAIDARKTCWRRIRSRSPRAATAIRPTRHANPRPMRNHPRRPWNQQRCHLGPERRPRQREITNDLSSPANPEIVATKGYLYSPRAENLTRVTSPTFGLFRVCPVPAPEAGSLAD